MRAPLKSLDYALASRRPLLIEELEISYRAWNALRNNGLVLVKELCKLSDRDVMAFPGIGKTCLNEIKEALAMKGHYLGQFLPDGRDRNLAWMEEYP